MEERGFTPETMVEDVQQAFGKDQLVPSTGKSCTVAPVTMANALTWSRNCASAYIMKQVGPVQFSAFLERINIPTHVDAYPSMALGAMDLSLYEVMWGLYHFSRTRFFYKALFHKSYRRSKWKCNQTV
jgi:penicillin-binding protein 1A